VTHVLDTSLCLYHFRLESSPPVPAPVMAPAAQQAAPQWVWPAGQLPGGELAPALQLAAPQGFFFEAPQAAAPAGGAGPSSAAAGLQEDLLSDASADMHVRSLTAGQAARVQARCGCVTACLAED
jgi:hypothetical protein